MSNETTLAAKAAEDSTKIIERVMRRDEDADLGWGRLNRELVNTVMAGFLLERLDDFLEWMGKRDLHAAGRQDCLRWINDELKKIRQAQRRLTWVGLRGEQALSKAAERLRAAYDEGTGARSGVK